MEKAISEIVYLTQTTSLELEVILRSVLKNYNLAPKKCELITTDDTWREDLSFYLKRQVIRGLRPKTIKHYQQVLSSAFEIIGKPLKEVNAMDVSLYMSYLKNVRNVSPRYMENIRTVLNNFFTWGVKNGYYEANPVDGIERIRFQPAKIRPLTEEEVERLRNACPQTRFPLRNRAIVEFLYSSGIRCNELINLDIKDIDLIRLEGTVRDGKGGKQRDFFFSDIAAYYVKQYLEERNDNNPALFLSKNRCRIRDDTGVENIITSLGSIGHVRNARPHRLRHTFIQRCVDKGMDIHEVMAIVGHANVQTTMIYYETNVQHIKDTYGRLFN